MKPYALGFPPKNYSLTSLSPATKVVAPIGSGFAADYYTPGDTTGVLDSVQIQAALTAVRLAGGGSVYLKAGTYYIYSTLNIGSNTHLYGDGDATLINYFNPGAGSSLLMRNYDQSNGNVGIKLSYFKIDGRWPAINTSNGSGVNQIYFYKSEVAINNVTVVNSPHAAIVLEACTYSILENNKIDGAADIGFYISDCNTTVINGNQVRSTDSYGIRIIQYTSQFGKQNNVTGNIIYNCGQVQNVDGLILQDGAEENNIVGNTILYSGRNGIYVATSAYFNISGNYCNQNDKNGIQIDGAARGNIIANNCHGNSQQTNNTYSGILLNNAFSCNVIGNRCGDTGGGVRQKYGISEAGTSDYNTIVGNMLDRNGTAGLLTIGVNTELGHNKTINSGSILEAHSGFTANSSINLIAGTATAGTAPLKFTLGTNLTTPEPGAMEYDGTNLFFTPASSRLTIITNGTTPNFLGLNDTNNNELIKFTTTASAVNELTLANAAIAGKPTLSATGDDTNINIKYLTKGTGGHHFVPGGNGTGTLRVYKSDESTVVLAVDTTNTRVGVGSSAPGASLDIVGKYFVNSSGLVSKYNNISTVSGGTPSELATIDSTGLTANVGASTFYVVPASGEGLYRVSAYLVTTTAASVSSTMPNAQVVYTDSDSNTSVTLDVSPILGAAGLGQSGTLAANTVGTVFSGTAVIYVKASTTIQYQTVNYASTAAGMAYALRMKLEAL